MNSVQVSFVLVTHNRLDCLKRAVSSIRKHCNQMNEVVVVDNASTDGTRGWLQQQSDIKTVLSDFNHGPGPARNRGVAVATGDFVFFLDDDAFLVDDVISPGVALLQKGPDVGCVAYPIWEETLSQIIYGRHPGPVKCFAAGGALFVKKALLDAGLFDEDILWSEEFDLSIRLHDSGYRIIVLEGPMVHHHAATSTTHHSTLKLRRIAYARWRSLLTRFRTRIAFIMCGRVAASILVVGLKNYTLLPIPLALWDIVRTGNQILSNREVVSKEVEQMFFLPDPQEDEFSVPISHKLNRLLSGIIYQK